MSEKTYTRGALRPNNRCKKAMQSAPISGLKAANMQKAVFLKEDLKNMLGTSGTGPLKDAALPSLLQTQFHSLGFRNESQASYQAGDAYKILTRYVGCERKLGRKYYYPSPMTYHIGGAKMFDAPDVLTFKKETDSYGNDVTCIEGIIWRFSKPTYTQRQADAGNRVALELYSILMYLRQYVRSRPDCRGKFKLKASVYWLRKNNDKHASLAMATAENFDEDFFDLKNAGNIVSIEETMDCCVVLRQKHMWDKVFAPAIRGFVNGLDESECTEKECETCVYRDACKYTETVMHIENICAARHLPDLMLTDAQEDITFIREGIHCVNAGAGTGKTLTVALLIASLVADGVEPEHILAITFTVSAADELRERARLYIEDLGCDPELADRIRIMTFNAFGYEQIKKDYKRLGFTAEPKVIDSVENYRIITKILNGQPEIVGLDYRNFMMDMPYVKGALITVADVFDVLKANNLGVGDERKVSNIIWSEKGYHVNPTIVAKVIDLYDVYDEYLRSENLIRFNDQLTMLEELLYQDPFYFESLNIEHILVDEFQDTDAQQMELIRKMCGTKCWKSLTVVGDDSQAIYGFRHTSPEFIIHFDELMADIGETQQHFLLDNYRCSGNIINFANAFNALNTNRVNKNLNATRDAGEAVHVIPFYDTDKNIERKFVVDRIERYIKNGTKPEDIAVLCFKKAELAAMADMLTERGIPSVMMSPQKITDNSRVQAGVCMLKAFKDPTDGKSMFTYASARTKKGLVGVPALEVAEAVNEANEKLMAIHKLEEKAQPAELLVLLKELDRNEDEVFESFIKTLEFKGTVEKMLEYAEDVNDFGDKSEVRCSKEYPGVVLTTAHSSKGLEWPIVFNMIGSYDNDSVHRNIERTEEMRRLMFVTSTRARDVLYITGNAVAYREKGTDGKTTNVVYNKFLIEAMSIVQGRHLDVDDLAVQKAEYDAAKAKLKAKQKKAAAAAKKAAVAKDDEKNYAKLEVHTLSGQRAWAKNRLRRHPRKALCHNPFRKEAIA